MSLETYKTFIVVVTSYDKLSELYENLETDGKFPINTNISRQVECVTRLPNSRVTEYLLSEDESRELMNCPYILNVAEKQDVVIMKFNDITSSNWDKSLTTDTNFENWGLLRVSETSNRSNWGSDGDASVTGTVKRINTGRNVDIVILEPGQFTLSDHPEFLDSEGNSRFIPYNWFQHNPEVTGGAAGNYIYRAVDEDHGIAVTSAAAGKNYSFAPDANIYHLSTDDLSSTIISVNYIREFHKNKNINPVTGRKNPTIVNSSWGAGDGDVSPDDIISITKDDVEYKKRVYNYKSGIFFGSDSKGTFNSSNDYNTNKPIPDSLHKIKTIGTGIPVLVSKSSEINQTGDQYTYNKIFTNLSNTDIKTISFNGEGLIDIEVGCEMSQTADVTTTVIVEDESGVVDTVVDTASGEFATTSINFVFEITDSQTYTFTISNTHNGSETGTDTYFLTIGVDKNISGTIENLTFSDSFSEIATMTDLGSPDSGTLTDGIWEISIPWNVSFFGDNYSSVFLHTKNFLAFETDLASVNTNSTMISPHTWTSDFDGLSAYTKISGTTPNRIFHIRFIGEEKQTIQADKTEIEYFLYENETDRIDLQIGELSPSDSDAIFTRDELKNFNITISSNTLGLKSSIASGTYGIPDLQDAMAEGIIFVSSAGNSNNAILTTNESDYNTRVRTTSSLSIFYIHRGQFPGISTNILPYNIIIGATDSTIENKKSSFSNSGTAITTYAPGRHIIGATWDQEGVPHPDNSLYNIIKQSGTSFSAPIVTGMLAAALEVYPYWNQRDAYNYLKNTSIKNILSDTEDLTSSNFIYLRGTNLHAYRKLERYDSGSVFPKRNMNYRKTSGMLYPRQRIKHTIKEQSLLPTYNLTFSNADNLIAGNPAIYPNSSLNIIINTQNVLDNTNMYWNIIPFLDDTNTLDYLNAENGTVNIIDNQATFVLNSSNFADTLVILDLYINFNLVSDFLVEKLRIYLIQPS
jgi:hypothetical protein